jgi:hypothetical protein
MSAAATLPSTTEETKPGRSGGLLALVRKLINYGQELAANLHQRAATDLRAVRHSFGIADIALILLRIKRGLLRAQALETRLEQSAARLDPPREPRAAPARRKPGPTRLAPPQAEDPNVPIELPTEAEIAEWVRRRPIGAVIADICRDFGILCDHPLWREIQRAIRFEGGSCNRLVMEIIHLGSRLFAEALFPSATQAPAGTGPPPRP